MSEEQPVSLGSAPPETVLPSVDPGWVSELETALALDGEERRAAVATVAARHPRYLDAWARLAAVAGDGVSAYAYARVGYHRGLDALRGAGWRGTGYVRWRNPDNRGFLRALAALADAAGAIGEVDEQERCRLFLVQLDPEWGRRGQG